MNKLNNTISQFDSAVPSINDIEEELSTRILNKLSREYRTIINIAAKNTALNYNTSQQMLKCAQLLLHIHKYIHIFTYTYF